MERFLQISRWSSLRLAW